MSKLDRWRQGDASAELQRILSSADLDQPSADQLARLSSKLESVLGPEWSNADASNADVLQPSAAASGGALQGAAGSSLGPILAVTTALVLGLGAAFLGLRPSEPPQPSVAEVAPARPAEPAAPPVLLPAAVEPPAIEPASPEPPAQVAIEPVPAPVAKSAAPVRAARVEGGGLGEELKQLEAIRRTLQRDPARALAATARHARRFPQGALGPERELLKIEALLRLERKREAFQLASRALANPHPYRAQILQLMAADSEQ